MRKDSFREFYTNIRLVAARMFLILYCPVFDVTASQGHVGRTASARALGHSLH